MLNTVQPKDMYIIFMRANKEAFLENYSYHVYYKLDHGKMKEAAEMLIEPMILEPLWRAAVMLKIP